MPRPSPLAVWRSTSTVGFPRESKISRAQIFSIDMMMVGNLLGWKRWEKDKRLGRVEPETSGRGQRLGGLGKRLLQWLGVGRSKLQWASVEGRGSSPPPWR